jgi:hypothetical protein
MSLRPVVAIVLAPALLVGCASSETVNTASVDESHIVTCTPAATVWAQCNKRAGEICGSKGFDVIKRVADQGTLVTIDSSGPSVGSPKSRMMVVRCKGERS